MVLAMKGDFAAAIKDAEKAVELRAESPAAWKTK